MIRSDITKNISQFVENQFPALYREEGEVLVSFIRAYYEYLEENGYLLNREMFTIRDIDTTFNQFLNEFRKKYIDGFPFITATDTRFLIKNVLDFYRSKGSDESIKLLMKLIFNDEVDVYYPSQDILRPSDSLWISPIYLEVSFSTRTKSFLNKKIVGSNTGATAIVENIITKRTNGKIIDIIYLTDVRGDFETGEFISDDGRTTYAPKIVGSLSEIEVDFGGSGYKIGDRLNVISPNGKNAIARVTEIFETNDAVQFNLIDGGFGYTLDSDTQVYVSTAMIFCDNQNLEFKDFEIVTQKLEKLTYSGNTSIEIGDTVFGFDTNLNTVGEGVVVKNIENTLTIEVREGSFARQFELQLSDQNRFFENEEVVEENIVELGIIDATGSFFNGEKILQRDIENEVSINVAVGVVDSIDNDTIFLSESFGSFIIGKEVEGLSSGSKATITAINITNQGNRGQIVNSSNTSITVVPITGDFSINSKIRGERSKNINEILSVTSSGLDFIEVSNTNINDIIEYENVSASGFVVGQTSGRVGLYGNTNPFIFVSGVDNFINSSETLLQKKITRIGFGSNANFEVGTLVPETEETFIYNRDLVSEENYVGVKYLDILVNGAKSGISRVSSNVTISDGGTGYSNSSVVTFIGGGYLDGTPLIDARANVITDEFGTITDINITEGGQGYFSIPEISISDGSGANVAISIEYGYGFPTAPYGGFFDTLESVWTNEEITLGEIFSLARINQGSEYDAGVFTKVVNSQIQKFNLYDLSITLTNLNGTFAVGEVVENSIGFKGRVKTVNNDLNIITIKVLSFIHKLSIGDTLTGITSGSTANVSSITQLTNSQRMGENAFVDSLVVLADGIIAKVEIVDSGYGYVNNRQVQLFDAITNEFATNGTAKLQKQGIGSGYWQTTTSQLNDKKLRDNFFYQEYSYQVVASFSFDKYEKILRDLLHVSGTELFGRVEKTAVTETLYDNTTFISKGSSFMNPELIAGLNIADVAFNTINLDPAFNSGVGRINSFANILNGGFGYSNNSIVEFVNGGGLSGNEPPLVNAQGYVVTDNNSSIVALVITNRGEGYTAIPSINISGGIGAEVQINIEYGYGFEKNNYATIQSVLDQTLGGGENKSFFETEVIYETDK